MRIIPDFTTYISWNEDKLILQLARISHDIAAIGQEIALAESEKVKGRVNAYLKSLATSETARKQDADNQVVTFTATMVELHSDLAALMEEKFFILRLLDRDIE